MAHVYVTVQSDDPMVVRAVAANLGQKLQEMGFGAGKPVSVVNSMDFEDRPSNTPEALLQLVREHRPQAFAGHTVVYFVHPFPPELGTPT